MSNSDDPMDAVRQYVEGFNNGDSAAMAGTCADPMQILDGMSPHVWQGPTAAEDWWRDVLAEGEHLGASGYRIALGEARHVDVNGDYAYVVVPATMTSTCAVRRSPKLARCTPSRSAKSVRTGVSPPGRGQRALEVRHHLVKTSGPAGPADNSPTAPSSSPPPPDTPTPPNPQRPCSSRAGTPPPTTPTTATHPTPTHHRAHPDDAQTQTNPRLPDQHRALNNAHVTEHNIPPPF